MHHLWFISSTLYFSGPGIQTYAILLPEFRCKISAGPLVNRYPVISIAALTLHCIYAFKYIYPSFREMILGTNRLKYP